VQSVLSPYPFFGTRFAGFFGATAVFTLEDLFGVAVFTATVFPAPADFFWSPRFAAEFLVAPLVFSTFRVLFAVV
jgi:hypothetical protein